MSLWGAIEPLPGLVFFGSTRAEFGAARTDSGRAEAYLEQLGARYVVSPAFVIDAGQLQPVVGTFAPRHLSTRNPLIGTPDGYSLKYPVGAEVSGEAGMASTIVRRWSRCHRRTTDTCPRRPGDCVPRSARA